MVSKILIDASELLKESYSDLPILIKGKTLMAPGTWNEILYTAAEIDNAFKNSDFDDKNIISLYANHEDQSVDSWVGYVRNLQLNEGGVVTGDLEVWNPLIGIYLDKAKAKFGISPKLKGFETTDGKLRNFTFENFSVVTNPAVKKAYINLSELNLQGGKKMSEGNKQVILSENEIEVEDGDMSPEEIAKKKAEDEAKKKAEESNAKKKPEEVKPKEEPCAKKPEVPKEDEGKKEEPKDPKEEEMSQEEATAYTLNSDWTDFVKQARSKNPNISFQDIAKAYKSKTNADKMLESLSDSELIEKLKQLETLLKKKGKYPYPDQAKGTDETAEVKAKNEALSNEVKILNAQLNEPNSKTISLASSIRHPVNSENDSAIKGMSDWLIQNAGKGGRIF